MKTKSIVQVLPTISYGDAVSNQALNIRDIVITMGYTSHIYAENIDSKLSNIKRIDELKKSITDNDVLILHMSTGSDVNDFVAGLPIKRKIMMYHNVTPAEYFEGYNPNLALLVGKGREQVQKYSNDFTLALGDSEYNRQELEDYGYQNTGVLSIIVEFSDYNRMPDSSIIRKYNDGRKNLIFVGRIAPNKKQEDIIKTFYYYKKYCDADARLFLAGSWQGMELYYKHLLNYIKILQLQDVYFTGHVRFEQLLAYYRIADIFLSMSEHEGFCVPLLESMYFDIPVIAYKSSAIPYTLGDSGIMFTEKNHRLIAEMIKVAMDNNLIRTRLLEKQRERLKYFHPDNTRELLIRFINKVVSIK